MRSRIGRSWLLALFSLLAASLLAALAALGLNDRFIDSARDGWFLFLLIPLAASVPFAVFAWIVSLLPSSGPESHADRTLGLFTALIAVPLAVLLLFGQIRSLLSGSTALGAVLLILIALLLTLGSFRFGRFLSRRLCPGGSPSLVAVAFLFLLLVLLPPFGQWLSNRPIRFDSRPRTLMLCVDGATWNLIDRFEREGTVPTFTRLREEGTWFNLEAERPLMSPIIWTTIASGVGPSEHGVQSFYATSGTVKVPRIWDMAAQKGMDVGLLAWPITWPPYPVPGFMIPSLFARGPETYPEELQFIRELAMMEKGKRKRELAHYSVIGIRMIQYGVKLSTLREAVRVATGKGDFLESMSAKRFLKLRIHSDLFLELWERYQPEFAAFYNNGVDVTSHYFWKYYEPEGFPDVTAAEAEQYGDMILRMYGAMDRALAKILRFAPPDLKLVVVSDHGLQGMQTEDSGTIRLIRTENFLARLGLEKSINGVNLASRVHLRAKRGRGFPSGLAPFIEDIVVEESGEPVFQTRLDGTGGLIVEVRTGVDLLGKKVLIPGKEACLADEIGEETYAKISGEHSTHAILILKAPFIRAGAAGGAASMVDVAPTVLQMMGLPLERRITGEILGPAFEEGWPRDHPPAFEDYRVNSFPSPEEGDTDDTILKEQLRSLGYLN